MAQQVTATLTPPSVNMMSNDDRCFVCGNTGHIGCHCPNAQCYNFDSYGHFAQDCPEKIPPLGTPHHHDRSSSWPCYNHNCRDRSQSLHYRCNQGKCNLTTAEAPAAFWGTHPTPHHANTAACNTHPLNDALGDTHIGTHHTGTIVTCLWHITLLARVTLMTILWTKANLVWDTLIILPTDHTHERHCSCIHEKQPLIHLSIRRRSLFRTHNWTLPQNETMTLILETTRAFFK